MLTSLHKSISFFEVDFYSPFGILITRSIFNSAYVAGVYWKKIAINKCEFMRRYFNDGFVAQTVSAHAAEKCAICIIMRIRNK